MNYLKPRCEKFFFCPAGVSLFTEDTVRVLMQKAKENEKDHEKSMYLSGKNEKDIRS